MKRLIIDTSILSVMAAADSIIDDFYKRYVMGFMIHDINSAIHGKANFLAALGLVAYTEFMGGVLRGTFKEGQYMQNFNLFIQSYFPNCYKKVDLELKNRWSMKNGLYGAVRSGLVHRYFIQGQFIIWLGTHKGCGTELGDRGEINFWVNTYFEDFKNATVSYYEQLKKSNDRNLVGNFMKAMRELNLLC